MDALSFHKPLLIPPRWDGAQKLAVSELEWGKSPPLFIQQVLKCAPPRNFFLLALVERKGSEEEEEGGGQDNE